MPEKGMEVLSLPCRFQVKAGCQQRAGGWERRRTMQASGASTGCLLYARLCVKHRDTSCVLSGLILQPLEEEVCVCCHHHHQQNHPHLIKALSLREVKELPRSHSQNSAEPTFRPTPPDRRLQPPREELMCLSRPMALASRGHWSWHLSQGSRRPTGKWIAHRAHP